MVFHMARRSDKAFLARSGPPLRICGWMEEVRAPVGLGDPRQTGGVHAACFRRRPYGLRRIAEPENSGATSVGERKAHQRPLAARTLCDSGRFANLCPLASRKASPPSAGGGRDESMQV